jgi:hypothetical protein
MKSKLLGLMALVSLVLALSGGAASAGPLPVVVFDWSTTGPSGSGTFTATDDGSGTYTITAITGTFNGGTITSLSLPGLGLGGNDNLLFYPGSDQLDISGFSFDEGPYGFNIYDDGGYGDIYQNVMGQYGGSITTFTASPSVTPLPAALPLFATGIGAMGLLGWRRKRKNAGVIAAA